MRTLLRKLAKGLLALGASLVIVAALGFGGFRWLVTQLPSYQDELQAWVNDSLGLRLEFARIDARWGWRGPELVFHEARLGASDQSSPFLTARMAGVGLRPFDSLARLATRRELGIDRLTLDGIELTLVQTADGALSLQGAPLGAAERASFALDVPPDVEVIVRNSDVTYLEPSRGRAWRFQDVTANMSRASGMLMLDARARPPSDLGSRVELRAQGAIENGAGAAVRLTGDWRLYADVRDVDLAVAARALPERAPAVPQAGNGDISIWLEWRGGVLVNATAAAAFDDLVLPRVLGTAGSRFERVALTGEWQAGADGWRLLLNDVEIARDGRVWPARSSTQIDYRFGVGGAPSLAVRSDFLRLEDLTPFLWPLPESSGLTTWLELAPRGDLRDASLLLEDTGDGWDYTIAADFTALGIEALDRYPGFSAVSGELRADPRSGRVELRTRDAAFDWPGVFRGELGIRELSGVVVWRQGQDAIRVVGDDLILSSADGATRSSLELTLPLDGSSPELDLTTGISTFDVAAVKRYLPASKMPPSVVAWLDEALQGGRVRDATLTFVGPVRAFPFDGGEGELRMSAAVEQGVLAFVGDWPAAEELEGTIEFVNTGFTTHGSGRVLGNRAAELRAGIADVRDPVLTVQTRTVGPLDQVLAFLRDAPLVMRHLGPYLERVAAPAGGGEVDLDLRLPLLDRAAYELSATLDMRDAELAVAGFAPHVTEINGTLRFADGVLSGQQIAAILLDGPVSIDVVTPEQRGYRARLDLQGEVAIDAVAAAFDWPFAELVAGQTRWNGSLLIPSHDIGPPAPARVTVGSNLAGVVLKFPAPFAKGPAEPTNLQLDLVFGADGGLDAVGYLGATRRFALQFDSRAVPEEPLTLRRAALRFGGALPEFRAERGVTVDGNLPVLRFDEWWALARAADESAEWRGEFAGATLHVADLSVLGQQLGASHVIVRRRTDDWQIEVDSGPIAGTVLVPADLDRDPQIVAVMRKLYLAAGNAAPMSALDPRRLPGLQLHSDEFAIGSRRLGRLDAEILSDPLGLRLVSFESASASFTAQGSGGWFIGDGGATTRFAVSVSSSDLGATLEELGFDPVIEAGFAEVTASLFWPGPPSRDWMRHVGGDLALRAETGSLLDVQPGAGRMVGLMSFAALPRRLALDFRDVFNRGFVFDEITADFVVIDGDAYTDNFKLTGPAAEIGVVGRTGLRDGDYRQQAVVTSEPGKMLPTVGGLLGGPGVAAALLIFTRVFKKPLQGIGRASYCVTGSWQEPVVERLTAEQLERGEICAELPPGTVPAAGVAAR